MSNGFNPCDVCASKDKASGCNNCILDVHGGSGTCMNEECMLNYDGGCLLMIDEKCKASTSYEDNLSDHDCSECVHFVDGDDGLYYCDNKYNNETESMDEIGEFDSACDEFEERWNEQ